MCDVCCAWKAVEATEKGQAARFVWNPEPTTSILANNPDAPPVDDGEAAPADWPFVLVQAELREAKQAYGVEGPGRFRFGFAENDMSEWVDDGGWLSLAIDGLGVSWGWNHLDERLRKALITRDKNAVFAFWKAQEGEGETEANAEVEKEKDN